MLHLLYARFWHKVLFDLGVVSTPEPFQRLVSQGMILGEVLPRSLQALRRAHVCDGERKCCSYSGRLSPACWLGAVNSDLVPKHAQLQVEFTVFRDSTGAYVAEDHPDATPVRYDPP